jgi:two-component system response regulator PilR (NtrC family)
LKKILLVDDEPHLREGIAFALRDAGYEVTEARDGEEACRLLESEGVFDLVLTDIMMPGKDGIEVLKRARVISESTLVMVMTAHGTVEGAVGAMQHGALDYIQKPFSLDALELKVRHALEHGRMLRTLASLQDAPAEGTFTGIVGESSRMQEVFKTVMKVAASNATVLVLGETGTGKELIAEAIHRNSERAGESFVKTNCAALHENLLESELFGHERGAFTSADKQRIGRFELANQGTLFLDEIGNMSLSTQSKVLRVLQNKEFERLGGSRSIRVDVRIVAATNKNLEEAITRGDFREDLYYRLNVVKIVLPPLRERGDDILPLARHFLERFSADLKKPVTGFSRSAVRAMRRHMWPGNIRELENTIERAVLMAEGGEIDGRDLNLPGADDLLAGSSGAGALSLPPEGIKLEDLERQAVMEALRLHDWVQKDAARFLGISARVMNYKVQKYSITNPRWTKNKVPAAV